jgi:predicted secreted hydrolase
VRHEVRGAAWLDREWSTSALEHGHEGWDWLGLRLDDGRELMLYRLRLGSGEASSASAGTLVAADGTARSLVHADVALRPVATWTSPHTGATYPIAWSIEIGSEDLRLEVAPIAVDQEHHRALVRYWEGAVRVTGTSRGVPASGVGYLELVGYAR